MLKHKKFLSLLLMLPVIGAFSCSKVKEPYHLIRQWIIDEVKDIDFTSHLNVTDGPTKTEYTTGEVLDITGINVSINGDSQVTRAANKDDIYNDKTFFVCSNASLPTNSFIGPDYKATSNVESSELTFYIAAAIKKADNDYDIYVAGVIDQFYKVTIKNPNAIKSWVWYTVTAVVIFAVVAMVSFTRHHKAKKEGNL